jgi:CheY-like chemotaxis protein
MCQGDAARSVLLVDDDDDVRASLADALTEAGYAVVQANHGEAALEALAAMPAPPCLVLLDLAMPVMSGAQFLAALESSGRASQPVVIISATDRPRDVAAARQLLRKPVSVNVVLAVTKELCG